MADCDGVTKVEEGLDAGWLGFFGRVLKLLEIDSDRSCLVVASEDHLGADSNVEMYVETSCQSIGEAPQNFHWPERRFHLRIVDLHQSEVFSDSTRSL